MTVTEYQQVTAYHHKSTLVGNTDAQKRVYDLLRQIPVGKISTYAALSKALNSSPRAVGGALRRNPYAPEVPCHRIICTDGVSSVLQTIYFKNSRRTVHPNNFVEGNWWIQGRGQRCAVWDQSKGETEIATE
jgi:O-6-methylguanine DNA methyltransferase